MTIQALKKIRNKDEYGDALVELVNDYHDRVGTPDDERPSDIKADLRAAVRAITSEEETDPGA